jgi:hypothetical protein
VHEHQLRALSKAWLITMVAVILFVASVGISDIWDRKTFARALEDVLLSNAL